MMDYIELKEKMLNVEPHKLDRAFWNLATEFEDSILTASSMPEDAFIFVVEVLSDERLIKQKGLVHFIRAIYTDFEKFSSVQADQLLKVLIKNHDRYFDELTRHAIADLIARKYPNELAIRTFREMSKSNSLFAKHIAFVGCDILHMHRTSPETVKRSAIRIRDEINLDKQT